MDIGTAKPGAELRAQVPHHLIDIIDPDQSYSAGGGGRMRSALVAEILERRQLPLLVGGTMLYFRALIAGLDALPQADARIRAELDADAARARLAGTACRAAQVDPETAARIAPNDAQRIQRALEVWKLTRQAALLAARRHAAWTCRSRLKGIALVPRPRRAASRASRQRFDAMLRMGLVDEVKGLRKKYRLDAAMPSMRCRRLSAGLGIPRRADRPGERCARRGIAATRQLAKRQLTWLRSFPDLLRLDAGGAQDPAVALHLLLDEGRQLLGR